MTQDMSYPDPEQLKTYSMEPMPFHDVAGAPFQEVDDDLSDHAVRADFGNVDYKYRATYIMVEMEEGWKHIEEVPEITKDHDEAWKAAMDFQIEEDFICATGMVYDENDEPHQYDAYWLLADVTIRNPDAYPNL